MSNARISSYKQTPNDQTVRRKITVLQIINEVNSIILISLYLKNYEFTILTFEFNPAFTLNGFDNQERNLTFVKTDFQVLTLKFLACSMKETFYPFYKQNIARA